jgi:predicted dehydrogenase
MAVRVGLVGYGNAARFHVPSLRELGPERCEIVAVCGRSRDRAEAFAREHGIPRAFGSMGEMLSSADVDVVDLVVPNHVHAPLCIEAAQAGKHIICEKHLTGYFGEPDAPPDALIGKTVPKARMLERVLEQCAAIQEAVEAAGVTFCYAENWVYAPSFAKLRRLAAAAGGTILRIEAEESHSGSPSPYAKQWRTAGGGSLVLKGAHPVGAVLQLKQWEGKRRTGRPIRPRSVVCEVGNLTWIEAFRREPKHYLKTDWKDVEDWGVMALTFEDGSVAEIAAGDTTLGGVHNYLEAYLSNARIRANMNPNNACVAYAPDDEIFGDEYITEKIETKGGWTFPSPEENWNQGYPQEMADFIDAIAEGREPQANLMLARDVTLVLYAAYVSAEEGRRVDLRPVLERAA